MEWDASSSAAYFVLARRYHVSSAHVCRGIQRFPSHGGAFDICSETLGGLLPLLFPASTGIHTIKLPAHGDEICDVNVSK